MERGTDRGRALKEAGLSPAAWIQLQRRWLEAIAAEIESGGHALANRYLDAFAAAGATVTPVHEIARHVIAPTPVAPAELPKRDDAVAHVPSYLRAASASSSSAPMGIVPPQPIPSAPQPSTRGTALALEVPRTTAIPFKRDALPLQHLASSPAPKPSMRIASGTALAIDGPRGPATPFRAEAGGASHSGIATDGKGARDAGSPRSAARPGSGTAWAPSTPAGPATPFEAPPPEAHGFDLMRYSDLVAARDEPGADMKAVLAAFSIDAAAHARVEAHWTRKFSENGLLALEFGRLVTQAKKALAARRAPRSLAPVGTGTALALDVPGAVTPFQRDKDRPIPSAPVHSSEGMATPANVPELSVDQYAFIVASLRKATDVPTTLARFRLTAESRKELEARWAKRMATEPAVREAFLAALGRHLSEGSA
jgi:hypothetical protein